MAGPTVAVFGGTGFLGAEIVRAVRAAGAQARIASRRPPPARVLATSGVDYVQADVRDRESVRKALAGATGAVNAVSLYVETRDETFEAIHVEGAERIARCAEEAGVEALVHVSGIGTDAASPSKFVRARARGERAVREAFERAAVVRPSVVFGRNDRFLAAIERATRLPVVPLFGNGDTRLQPALVSDVAAAIARLATSPSPTGRVYELGGAEILSYREIVNLVMAHLGRRRPLVPVPFGVWKIMADTLAALPSPPLTRDQVILMQSDNVASAEEASFADLGIAPAGLTSKLADCL